MKLKSQGGPAVAKEKQKLSKRVSQSDIDIFNQMYYDGETFKSIAVATGFSASTVSKYVDRNWEPEAPAPKPIRRFTKEEMPPFSSEKWRGVENWGDLLTLSYEEEMEVLEVLEELENDSN